MTVRLVFFSTVLIWIKLAGCNYDPEPQPLVVFTAELDGNWDLFLVQIDGSGLARLTEHPASDRGPWWSVDGECIIFRSDRSGESRYYSIKSDGSDLQPFEPGGTLSPSGNATIRTEVVDGFPQLVLESEDTLSIITDNQTDRIIGFADWSQDENTILYLAGQTQGSKAIWMLDLSTGHAERLTEPGGTYNTASFSPDGTRIAFNSNRDGLMSTYTMQRDGTGVRRWIPDRISAHASWVTDDLLLLDTESEPGVFDVHTLRLSDGTLGNLSRMGNAGWPSARPVH